MGSMLPSNCFIFNGSRLAWGVHYEKPDEVARIGRFQGPNGQRS